MPYRTVHGMKALKVLVMQLEVARHDDNDLPDTLVRDLINDRLQDLNSSHGIIARAELEEVAEAPSASAVEELSKIVYLPAEVVYGILKDGHGYLGLAQETLGQVDQHTFVAGLLKELARRL